MKIPFVCEENKSTIQAPVARGALLVMISKKENSHELVVPANALWDVWFCDTDSLWTNEKDKQRQKETFNSVKLANKDNRSITRKKEAFTARCQKRQLEGSPETKSALSTDPLNCNDWFPIKDVVATVAGNLQET